MKELRFVDADKLETLEDYATSLLTGMYSLRTLDTFHASAFKKGLLKEDEIKNAEAINHTIISLLKMYQYQMENILERSEVTEEQILKSLISIMPNVEMPIKKKKVRKKNEIPNIP